MEYLTDKETYLNLKSLQKEIAEERKSHKIHHEYNKKYDEWLDLKSTSNIEDWIKDKPVYDYYKYSSTNARYINIIYSMIKGRKYKDVESKVRDGNEIDLYKIRSILNEYNIDPKGLFNKLGELV